ncbi:hypothetical protein ACFS7Z_19960 [Pontibacter toksunensis]|uniref:Uncharacterized protein n=1 Tax=Pontibacter toksunensis TaxID=1332631 RepID=A0ABW6BYK6_9BACT
MWRRRIFNRLLHIRRKAAGWANLHQKAMVAGMFCLMACGIIWLVASREEAQGSFDATAKLLYSGLDRKQQARPVTSDMMEMMRLYGEVQRINPDSLTVQDSAFLKDIDKQLNRIIHE